MGIKASLGPKRFISPIDIIEMHFGKTDAIDEVGSGEMENVENYHSHANSKSLYERLISNYNDKGRIESLKKCDIIGIGSTS